jgi:hypothetical protein
MNINLIKILSFFIGLFITLIIISFYKINEHFTINTDFIDAIPNTTNTTNTTTANNPDTTNTNNTNNENFKDITSDTITAITDTVNDLSLLSPMSSPIKILADLSSMISKKSSDNDDDSEIPFSGYKFICINTYKNIDKISIADGRWYDIDTKKTYDKYNYNHYFKFSKIINFEKNRLNKHGALGAHITNNELLGPSCSNFANNSETYELHEFTMFMTVKILSCLNKNNIIFEMTGNTTTTNKIIPTYTTSIININIIVNANNNYDIHLRVGDEIYKGQIDNIDKALISETEYITIGLFYTKKKIGFVLNDKLYEYVNKCTFPITLGSIPLIINKYGSLNMYLYNFVYYKSLYDFTHYDELLRYNNYYLSGLYGKTCPVSATITTPKPIISSITTKLEKIILPEFKYSMLHKKRTNDDDDDDDNDDDDSNNIAKIFREKEETEEDKAEEINNEKCYLKDLKDKVKTFIDKTELDDEQPSIFKRIFGF